MSSSAPSRLFSSIFWSPLARRSLPLSSVSEWCLWPIALTSCLWIVAFILLRSVQPYPLDAFEEYEMQKAMRWADGAKLYGAPGVEPFPEAYPPLYFVLLGVWQHLVGPSFLTQRVLSLVALAGALGFGLWALRDAPARHIGRLVFVTGFFSLHTLCARFFEVGKPDMLFTLFVAGAFVTARHRTIAEVIISSLSIWFASLTKQNGPLFIAPIALWHFSAGRPRWAVLWSLSVAAVIGASYGLINCITAGHFWSWVFVWTAGHGVDFGNGGRRTMQALLVHAPCLLILLPAALVFRRQCPWTWCLVAALGVALLGMSKAGGRESHLLPVAYTAALVAGSWFAELWQCSPRDPHLANHHTGGQSIACPAFASPNERAPSDALPVQRDRNIARAGRWRCAMTIVLLIAIMAGLPTRRDFRWIAKRSQETSDWVAAVQRLDGRVAVSHHLLLARGAGAECFFSDLILEFRGLRVPADIQRRIAQEQFDYIVLCNDPRTSATTGWAELIEMHYEPAGQLNYADVSAVLPNRVYRKKSGLAAARY